MSARVGKKVKVIGDGWKAVIPTASHIGLTPHTIALFGGFKIRPRRRCCVFAIQDVGCFMLDLRRGQEADHSYDADLAELDRHKAIWGSVSRLLLSMCREYRNNT
jgi:hypothetical protein